MNGIKCKAIVIEVRQTLLLLLLQVLLRLFKRDLILVGCAQDDTQM
jgi:hypothetical protein